MGSRKLFYIGSKKAPSKETKVFKKIVCNCSECPLVSRIAIPHKGMLNEMYRCEELNINLYAAKNTIHPDCPLDKK